MLRTLDSDKETSMKTGGRILYDRDRTEGRRTEGSLTIRQLVFHGPKSGSLHVDDIL
jgi:hypothetical protein